MCCPKRGLACVVANGVSGRCACDSVGQWNERMWNIRKQLARFLCDYLVFMTAGCPRRGWNWNLSNCPARQHSQLLMWTQGSESVGISSSLLPNPVAATAHSAVASHTLLHCLHFGPGNHRLLSISAARAPSGDPGSRPWWNWSGIMAISSSLCVPVRIEAGDVTDNFCTEGDLISPAKRRKTLS